MYLFCGSKVILIDSVSIIRLDCYCAADVY
jgi:hypothetical protein